MSQENRPNGGHSVSSMGYTPARRNLVSVQAAGDDVLRNELTSVAPANPLAATTDQLEMLVQTAEHWEQDVQDRVHPLHLAFATMAVLRHRTVDPADLRPITRILA